MAGKNNWSHKVLSDYSQGKLQIHNFNFIFRRQTKVMQNLWHFIRKCNNLIDNTAVHQSRAAAIFWNRIIKSRRTGKFAVRGQIAQWNLICSLKVYQKWLGFYLLDSISNFIRLFGLWLQTFPFGEALVREKYIFHK